MKQGEALRITSITRWEFDKIVAETMEKTANEAAEKCGGMATFIIPMVGVLFAKELRDRLFPEEVEGDAANSAR